MFTINAINLLKLGAAMGISMCSSAAFSASSSQLYFGLGNATFDPITAFTQGVEDDALALEFGYERRLSSGFVWGAGLNWYAYSDNNGFSVQTESVFGNVAFSDIDTGAYFSPKVVYTFDNMWTLGLSYSGYVSADVESLITLQVGKRFSFLGGTI